MAEGLTVIAAGLMVVLCIMASMFVLIEVILKIDQILKNRAERASAREEARRQEPEASRGGDEVIAAIGLALQQHLARRVAPRSAVSGTGSEPAPWASSGRLGIMTERQRVTSRRR